jgi:hypothetical protein
MVMLPCGSAVVPRQAGYEGYHFEEEQQRRVPDQRLDAFDGASLVRHQRQRHDNAVKPDELAEKDRQRRHEQLPGSTKSTAS